MDSFDLIVLREPDELLKTKETHVCFSCSYCKRNCPICESCCCRGRGVWFDQETQSVTAASKYLIGQKKTTLRGLLALMAKHPRMYAITREAFVATIAARLEENYFEGGMLYQNDDGDSNILPSPEGEVTEEFAKSIVQKALRIMGPDPY